MDIEINLAILTRIANGSKLSDPCVICGGKLSECGHTIKETASVIKRAHNLSKARRLQIIQEGK